MIGTLKLIRVVPGLGLNTANLRGNFSEGPSSSSLNINNSFCSLSSFCCHRWQFLQAAAISAPSTFFKQSIIVVCVCAAYVKRDYCCCSCSLQQPQKRLRNNISS